MMQTLDFRSSRVITNNRMRNPRWFLSRTLKLIRLNSSTYQADFLQRFRNNLLDTLGMDKFGALTKYEL
jgi:hypothetical protein